MIELQNIENAIKQAYLPIFQSNVVISDNILKKIKVTTADICGREIKRLDSTDTEKSYSIISRELKNLYVEILFSKKALRAAQYSTGAFVELINSEFESAISKAVKIKLNLLYSQIREFCKKEYSIRAIRRALKTLSDDDFEQILYHHLCDWQFLEENNRIVLESAIAKDFQKIILVEYGEFSIPKKVLEKIKQNIEEETE